LSKCTVLVADSMKRTVKLLCMVGRGVPVVGESWLVESRASKRLVDPWLHILKEPAAEKKLGMRLEDSVRLARKQPLLSGLQVHVTMQVTPPPTQFKDLIECAGGTFVSKLPTKPEEGLYAVASPADKAAVMKLRKVGVPVMDKEWILTGILKQKLDPSMTLA